ncbi:hypothetical protein QCA50_006466 [Cerrena zonata]|uniref:Uncharacterized protein n=1 Tax=Cerrena zonata TaxID=2478898 RepID=A0AAW0GBJ4_9APHY
MPGLPLSESIWLLFRTPLVPPEPEKPIDVQLRTLRTGKSVNKQGPTDNRSDVGSIAAVDAPRNSTSSDASYHSSSTESTSYSR